MISFVDNLIFFILTSFGVDDLNIQEKCVVRDDCNMVYRYNSPNLFVCQLSDLVKFNYEHFFIFYFHTLYFIMKCISVSDHFEIFLWFELQCMTVIMVIL